MNKKRLLSSAAALMLSLSSALLPTAAEENAQVTPSAPPSTITPEMIRSTQYFLQGEDFNGIDTAPDMDQNGVINAVDLTLAKRIYLETNTLDNFKADISDILLSQEQTVTFTVHVQQPGATVTLYDDTGTEISEMFDDGTHGDKVPEDGTYTVQQTLMSDDFKNVDYYAASGAGKSKPYRVCFYRDLTAEEMDGFRSIMTDMSAISDFDKAAAYVKANENIVSYTIDEALQTVLYRTAYHCTGFWQPLENEEEAEWQGRGKYALSTPFIHPDSIRKARKMVRYLNFTPTHPNHKDIIVLQPYLNAPINRLSSTTFQQAGELLGEALHSNVTVVSDEAVSMEQMKQLAGYGVVLINSHGCVSSQVEGVPIVCIGEFFYRETDAEDARYSADLAAERIVGTVDFHVAITPEFISHYYDYGDFAESMWYVGSCDSMTKLSFASALSDKGAAAVVGHVNSVHTRVNEKTMFEVMINSLLLSGDDLLNTMKEVKRIYGRDRHLYYQYIAREDNTTCYAEYWGDPSYTLVTHVVHPRYKLFDIGLTWEEAKEFCEDIDGHLATITSQEEQADIVDLLQKGLRNSYWLGARSDDTAEMKMKWITGEKFDYAYWAPGQPDSPEEDCLMIYCCNHPDHKLSTKMQWNDLKNDGTCGEETFFGLENMGFICEWEDRD